MRRQGTMSQELTELRARVLKWRKQEGGGRGRRIPKELWQEAIGVTRIDGVYATARATRFNYQRLKQLSGGGEARGEKEPAVVVGGQTKSTEDGEGLAAGGARFIALQVAPPRTSTQTMIELVGRQGEWMRIEVVGELDVGRLVQSLWSRPS